MPGSFLQGPRVAGKLLNVDESDAATSELIVEFEEPSRHFQVFGDELRKTFEKLVDAVDTTIAHVSCSQ